MRALYGNFGLNMRCKCHSGFLTMTQQSTSLSDDAPSKLFLDAATWPTVVLYRSSAYTGTNQRVSRPSNKKNKRLPVPYISGEYAGNSVGLQLNPEFRVVSSNIGRLLWFLSFLIYRFFSYLATGFSGFYRSAS